MKYILPVTDVDQFDEGDHIEIKEGHFIVWEIISARRAINLRPWTLYWRFRWWFRRKF